MFNAHFGLRLPIEPASATCGGRRFTYPIHARSSTSRRRSLHTDRSVASILMETTRLPGASKTILQSNVPGRAKVSSASELPCASSTRHRISPAPSSIHDLGDMPLRAESLEFILGLRAETGWVILDDMHKTKYAPVAEKTSAAAGLRLYSLRDLTLDRYGRFACLCG